MRTLPLIMGGALLALAGCGLENFAMNAGHDAYPRPASAIRGTVADAKAAPEDLTVTDGAGNTLTPFETTAQDGTYEVKLPSGKYQMLEVHLTTGEMTLRAIVPEIGEETEIPDVNVDARSTAEALIAEASLSAKGKTFKQVSPGAYVATRKLIQQDFDRPGATQAFLKMVERIVAKFDPSLSATEPFFFGTPVLNPDFSVDTSPVNRGWIARNPFDYDGDGKSESDTSKFDALLSQLAQQYKPEGCPDPEKIRTVFTVDFGSDIKNGVCGNIDRFNWATDKPGKTMFFVGWVHKDSPIQDPEVNSLLGASVPNQLQMYDDGTNGDAVAGDNIYTITFDLPRGSPGNRLRIGYKYTWGMRGQVWTGSEEWPGNSRILEVVDENGDDIVYRHDTFGDEATNKDNGNLNPNGNGSITWTTDLHGCGVPEAHENKYDNNSCSCTDWQTPEGIGPLTVACTGT